MKQSSRKCRQCGHKTLHVKSQMISDGMGCLLTIITGGLFLLLWLVFVFFDIFQPWRCQVCGRSN